LEKLNTGLLKVSLDKNHAKGRFIKGLGTWQLVSSAKQNLLLIFFLFLGIGAKVKAPSLIKKFSKVIVLSEQAVVMFVKQHILLIYTFLEKLQKVVNLIYSNRKVFFHHLAIVPTPEKMGTCGFENSCYSFRFTSNKFYASQSDNVDY